MFVGTDRFGDVRQGVFRGHTKSPHRRDNLTAQLHAPLALVNLSLSLLQMGLESHTFRFCVAVKGSCGLDGDRVFLRRRKTGSLSIP